MRAPRQIEETAEEEVVVEKAVAHAIAPHKNLKRDLQVVETISQEFHKLFTCVVSQAADPAEQTPNAQKLFLHRSLSKYKPDETLLKQWMECLFKAPAYITPSGCIITLIQPQTKRPNRAFFNPTKPKTKNPYNDSLTYAQIVLMYDKRFPAREQDEASHICGHGRCVNPEHLLWESCSVNFTRNECHHYNTHCTHVPRCLSCTAEEMQNISNLIKTAIANKKAKLTKYFCKNKG